MKDLYVASIAVFNDAGLLLLGKRQDTKKWCCPGGKFEPSEHPSQAALRELWEETKLVPVDGVEFIGNLTVKQSIHVFTFKATVDTEPNHDLDPDEEFIEFRWVNPARIPNEIMDNLHNKQDVTLQLLGYQDQTLKNDNQCWRSKDGLAIPTQSNPKRLIWNEQYHNLIVDTFAKSQEVLACQVDISKLSGSNVVVNPNRFKLYKAMLKAGETLPPVVLRYDGDGLNLVDGNHRQAAAIDVGIDYINAVVVYETNNLEKSVSGLAGLMATGLLMGGSMKVPQPTTHSVTQGTGIKAWTPDNLHEDLFPIAQLESSGGKNMNHKANPAGEYHTAYGALGFKPSTAHDEYKKSPMMQKKYPGLSDPAAFLQTFKQDPKFYNLLSSAHFARLKARHGPNGAVYGWRFGSGAALKASEDLIDNNPYVIQYNSLKKNNAY